MDLECKKSLFTVFISFILFDFLIKKFHMKNSRKQQWRWFENVNKLLFTFCFFFLFFIVYLKGQYKQYD